MTSTPQDIVTLQARVQELEVERLNYATALVDEERRRWYRALEAAGLHNLEGLAPEMVAKQVEARVQELEREVARLRGCPLCSQEHEADCDLAFSTCTCKGSPDPPVKAAP